MDLESRNCIIRLAKTKTQISFAVNANMICAFVSHMQNIGLLMRWHILYCVAF